MPRRFIAGAICPECGAQDTLVVEMLDGTPQNRSCVKCDFSDDTPELQGSMPRGRLEKAQPPASEEAQPVRLLDPKPRSS